MKLVVEVTHQVNPILTGYGYPQQYSLDWILGW